MTGIDKLPSTWALVPLKSPDRAKSRLAGVLSPVQRTTLFFALAERVIHALRGTPGIDNVVVVTASPRSQTSLAPLKQARSSSPPTRGCPLRLSPDSVNLAR